MGRIHVLLNRFGPADLRSRSPDVLDFTAPSALEGSKTRTLPRLTSLNSIPQDEDSTLVKSDTPVSFSSSERPKMKRGDTLLSQLRQRYGKSPSGCHIVAAKRSTRDGTGHRTSIRPCDRDGDIYT